MKNTLSLFDGISCGQVALKKKHNIGLYLASEIDVPAIKITQHNFPDTIQLGDVKKINVIPLYLSEVYDYLCKKHFNNDIYRIQSIISKREMLHRIVEEQTMSAYFGTQIQDEESKISSNSGLSINDRIWFWKHNLGSNENVFNIIRSGERRKTPNTIDVGELCKHSFWWNGNGQSEPGTTKKSLEGTSRKSGIRSNKTKTTGSRDQTIFKSIEPGISETKFDQTISRPSEKRELFNINEETGSERYVREKEEDRRNKTTGEVCNTENTLPTNNDVYDTINDDQYFLSLYNETQVTLVECEWGIIIFKGKIDICFAGSPCQRFSSAGKRDGMSTKDDDIETLTQYLILKEQKYKFNGDSYLYWEFVRILEEAKPTNFLLENVVMIKKWKDIISKSLGVLPIRINSSLVSAQNRDRYYWANIPGITTPEDKVILISDIDEKAIGGCGTRNQFAGNYYPDGIRKKYDEPNFTVRKDFKSNCLTCGGNLHKIMMNNGHIRFLTIDEWEKLQTLPVGYTDIPGLSITDRKCSIGNGWTVNVITHILNFIPYEELP